MSLNWGKLLAQGRCKAYGVPWSEEEQVARQAGIPAEFVRQGVLSVEEFEKVKDSPERKFKPREDLHEEAKEKGVEFAGETTSQELVEMIEVAEGKEESDDSSEPDASEEDEEIKKEDEGDEPESEDEEEQPQEEADEASE